MSLYESLEKRIAAIEQRLGVFVADKPTVAADEPQYRFLEVGEVIREGDEWCSCRGWEHMEPDDIGCRIGPYPVVKCRRRVGPSAKPAHESPEPTDPHGDNSLFFKAGEHDADVSIKSVNCAGYDSLAHDRDIGVADSYIPERDDEASKAIERAMRSVLGQGYSGQCAAVIKAVRAGKVPGIYADMEYDEILLGQLNKIVALEKERDDLKAKVEELTKLWDAERERADEAERDHVACGDVLKEQIAHVNRLTDENARLREFLWCFEINGFGFLVQKNGIKPAPLTDKWLAAKPKGERA